DMHGLRQAELAALPLVPALWRTQAAAQGQAEAAKQANYGEQPVRLLSLQLTPLGLAMIDQADEPDDRGITLDDQGRPLANASRASRIRKIAGEWRGSAAREAAIEVRAYSDATMFDLMHDRGQLSDAQHRAATKLYRLWTNAGRNPRMSGVYGERVGAQGTVTLPDDTFSPLDLYRAAIRPYAGRMADLLEGVMLGRHPGWQLADYQYALDDLVREWGLQDYDGSFEET